MTFFKQITLILSIFLVTILTTVLVINFINADQSVQKRLLEDATNTATSLSLSLGGANGDTTLMETMINANFDNGEYHLISLVDVDGKVIYEKKNNSQDMDIPQWFLNLTTIKAPTACANVSAGWNQVGVLYVQSDASYAYTQLYNITLNLFAFFIVLSIVGLIVLNLILATLLKPLKQVQLQAEAVTKNKFILQKKIPKTKEFKEVVLGMNNMVSKIKTMFDKANEELKKQKEMEYIDPITKLKNRKYLIDKLPQYLKEDAFYEGGVEVMLCLSGVIEANKAIGRQNVDKLFAEIAKIFQQQTLNDENSIVARMNGTEFSILLPNSTEDEAIKVAEKIYKETQKTIESYSLDTEITFISIGLYKYNHKQTIGEVLSLCDNALAKAKFNNSHIYFDRVKATEIMGKDAWRNIINQALKTNGFYFTMWNVVDTKNNKIDHNALSITMKISDSKIYPYGQFMASAHQVGLSLKIYQHVVDMLFTSPDTLQHNKKYTLRLSYEYLHEKDTYQTLLNLCQKYAKDMPFKLIVEIPEKLIRQNPQHIKLYKELFEKYDIEMSIFEFMGENANYHYLQDMRPLYIKADASYFTNQNKQAISSLKLITDTLDITLVATSVMDAETLKKLHQQGIHTVQGHITEDYIKRETS